MRDDWAATHISTFTTCSKCKVPYIAKLNEKSLRNSVVPPFSTSSYPSSPLGMGLKIPLQ